MAVLKHGVNPCEMCWKRLGDAIDGVPGVLVCYGCRADLERALNFLAAKGWQIQQPLPIGLPGINPISQDGKRLQKA